MLASTSVRGMAHFSWLGRSIPAANVAGVLLCQLNLGSILNAKPQLRRNKSKRGTGYGMQSLWRYRSNDEAHDCPRRRKRFWPGSMHVLWWYWTLFATTTTPKGKVQGRWVLSARSYCHSCWRGRGT